MRSGRFDVVVVGGGHNGLVAATLLARAGRSVCLLEASDRLGGATAGELIFDGVPARLSRYAYLVSLLPDTLIAELGLGLRLVSRAVASYTPTVRAGRAVGLLVEQSPGPATQASFTEVTGSEHAWREWVDFHRRLDGFAGALTPTLLEPLPRRSEIRDAATRAVGAAFWDQLVEQPVGMTLEAAFSDDLVRGVVATDALIGTQAGLHDPELRANRCFLYHAIREWRVPVGGMGAVADALVGAAVSAGVRLCTQTTATGIVEHDHDVEVSTVDGHTLTCDWLLAACAPSIVDQLRGAVTRQPEGSQLKVNMVLRRLPALRTGLDPSVAFTGTLHLEQGYRQLLDACAAAESGALPDPLPVEVYCHSLTDRSILAPELADRGYHTLTLFGLHTPARLFRTDPQRARERAVFAALASFQAHLAEPLDDVLAVDAHGRPCLEALTPLDLERSLRMPGGHIFHGDLSWPWLEDDEPAGTPAQRRGVALSGSQRVLLAGAASRRGGAVSGLGGLHAARAVLETRG